MPKIEKQSQSSFSFIAELSSWDGEFRTKKGTQVDHVYPSLKKLSEMKKIDREGAKFLKDSIRYEIDRFEAIIEDSEKLTKILYNKKQNEIDILSFVDFIILQELFKNVDGYRRSAYFQKKQNGMISMGPLWDFNLAMGNLSFYDMDKPFQWLHKQHHFLIRNAFWFKDFVNNKTFRNILIARYKELRKDGGDLSVEKILSLVDHKFKSLKGAPERDYNRWKDTGTFITKYIFVTEEKGFNAHDHKEVLKNWLGRRITWMDGNLHEIHK